MLRARALQLLGMAEFGSLKYAFVGRKGVASKSHINFDADGITEAEDAEIRAVWNKMAGNTSYSDALRAISRKRELTKLEIKDRNLIIQYSNGDFVAAHLNDDLTAQLLEANLNTIAPEPNELNFKP